MVHGLSIPVLPASLEAQSPAGKAKINFASRIFKKINSPISKILFGRDVVSDNSLISFNVGDLR